MTSWSPVFLGDAEKTALDWPIRLPARDPRNILTGDAYKPFKKATDGRLGMVLEVPNVRWRRCSTLLSHGHEFPAAYSFWFDSRILDCREQYPMYDEEKMLRRLALGGGIPENELATLDFVLTTQSSGKLQYHIVNIKPREDWQAPEVIRRNDREIAFADRHGWTWQQRDGSDFNRESFQNHLILRSWLRGWSIEQLFPDVPRLSCALHSTSAKGPMQSVLKRIGKSLDLSLEQCCRVFAAAICLGWLEIEAGEKLRLSLPIPLVKSK